MTPREFFLTVEGYTRAQEAETRRAAWQACIVANVWLPRGKRLTVDDLLGKRADGAPVLLDKASLRQYMRGRMEQPRRAGA